MRDLLSGRNHAWSSIDEDPAWRKERNDATHRIGQVEGWCASEKLHSRRSTHEITR